MQLMAIKLHSDTYSGEQLTVKGVITVQVQYKQKVSLPLIVANKQESSVLGKYWLTMGTGLNFA